MNRTSQSVLITGANGFIGSRLSRLFVEQGFKVVAGVRRTADVSLLAGIPVEFRHGDVTDPGSLPDMVRGVDCIIHNAGLVKAKSRQRFFEVNETGTSNLLQAVASANPTVRKLVLISSLAAAGPSDSEKPITELDPPRPLTVYGESKLVAERVALTFKDKINIAMVRPPGVYGPGDKEMLTVFKTVNSRIRPLFGNPARRIQLVHVDDLCFGIFRATVAETRSGSIFYIAENRSYAMSELVGLLKEACGKRAFPLYVPAPLFKLIASISEYTLRLFGATPMLTREKSRELLASWEISTEKAKTELGFESRIGFAEGAKQTFDWYRAHGWL
ncbi:MAG TPA: SDR family NAD(P)-dependent oxidoreductase [Candidatus Acidoferrum sp.]|nr:SDR family NAD(P)-dependent oxidoreductase [Candidatus Acidoferrum sp.]